MLSQNQQIFEQIKKADNILITFNKTWNGDAVASALAFCLILRKMGKKVEIAAEKNPNSNVHSFLPEFGKIAHSLDNLRKFVISLDITNAKVDKIKYQIEGNSLDFVISPKEGFFTPDDIKSKSANFKYDLVITLDTSDLEALGTIYDNDTEFFYNTPIINIGHSSDNEEYGQINCVELTKLATSEILFDIFGDHPDNLICEDVATCLLTGIISKTKSFKTQNVTPQVLSISSQLISLGARREEIVNKLYRSRSLAVLKLWGRVLARLSGTLDNKLVWSGLSAIDFAKTKTSENDLAEVIDELIVNIPQAKIVILFYEKLIKGDKVNAEDRESALGQKDTKTSHAMVYSIKNINSLELVKRFKPSGTKYLAEISSKEAIQDFEKRVIEAVQSDLRKIGI